VSAAAAPLLEARGLGFVRGGRRVLDGVDLAFRPGEWTAVVGPNGAGKSTLLSLLAGLLPPATGTLQLLGRPLGGWPVRERARRLTWLSQTEAIAGEIPAREVVRLGRLPRYGLLGTPDADDERAVDAALEETESVAFAARRIGELSGGERQRVLLARAFALDAEVYLLDEPTLHLDPPHQRRLVQSLRARARSGAAAVSILHDLTLALAADRLVVLAGGRVAADGSPDDPEVRAMLRAVFGDAFTIEALGEGAERRWAALPSV
jgi:iron complex transport system ATP-binding protein